MDPISSIICEARPKFISYYGPTRGQIKYERFVDDLMKSQTSTPHRLNHLAEIAASRCLGMESQTLPLQRLKHVAEDAASSFPGNK